MNITINAPFGSFRKEAGALFLIANYLRSQGSAVTQLRCNGVVSLCDRDAASAWNRELDACFICEQEQRLFGDWAGLDPVNLSRFIEPKDVQRSREWIASFEASELMYAEVKGVLLYDLCRKTFARRFSTDYPDFSDKEQEKWLRRLMTSAARLILAYRNYFRSVPTDIGLALGDHSFMSRAFQQVTLEEKKALFTFMWDDEQAELVVHNAIDETSMRCGLLFDNIEVMRADSESWPIELIQVVDEVLMFMGITSRQLVLPLAN
jgi:hypothetical protein